MEQQKELYHAGTLVYTRKQLAKVCFWLLWGDVCYMLMESVVPSILPLKLGHLGASNTAIGLILVTIPLLINTVGNPVISFRSDRYRSKWGRRIPFILFTLPFLVICLTGVGYADKIGFWVQSHYGSSFGHLTARSVAVVSIGVFMVAFSFLNTFVNSVFWYLFNDVVPEHLLARFMSWFRLVSMASASIYNLFIFQYAGTHSTEIIVGAGILYFVGFGLMCLNVKEGEYPPPPAYVDGQSGPLAAAKTFVKECHGLRHYWYQFLSSVFATMSGCVGMFMLFFYQSTGLNLAQIGRVAGCTNIVIGLLIPFSGWLADRYHPIRVVVVGYMMNILIVLPASMIWFFWHPSPKLAFLTWMVIGVGLAAPATAIMGVADPPLLMRVFPRDRYGQFCSANAMWRSMGGIVGGVMAGVFFDTIKRHVGPGRVYCFIPVWQLAFTILSFICVMKLYKSWKRYGGDTDYAPPICNTVAVGVGGDEAQ